MSAAAAAYIRARADQHRRQAAISTMSEIEQAEWRHSARHLDVIADEIEAEFHVDDEDDV